MQPLAMASSVPALALIDTVCNIMKFSLHCLLVETACCQHKATSHRSTGLARRGVRYLLRNFLTHRRRLWEIGCPDQACRNHDPGGDIAVSAVERLCDRCAVECT